MNKRCAFTLVELVVVILILGILAGVAAPKLLKTSGTATDNGIRQTLSIVRDAIELYTAENGGDLPPCANTTTSLQTALAPYIRGTFPICPVGAKDNEVASTGVGTTVADPSPTEGWKYNTEDGTFICNSAALSNDNMIKYEDF